MFALDPEETRAMSANPMPQAVVDRVLAFMLAERTGSIELHFKAGHLLNVRIVESLRIGACEREPAPNGLDRNGIRAQDSD